MNICIEKLTEQTLEEAENLRNEVFEKDENNESLTLRASLNPQKYQEIYNDNFINWMEYWVAKVNEKVVGIIGLYSENDNNHKICWLGWFAVTPKFRGLKIGKKLLEFAIEEAKKRKYKTLKVYTYELKNYLTAIDFYKKEGFKVIENNKKTKMIVLEKKICYFKYYFERDNIGMVVEVTPKRVAKVLGNEPFIVITASKIEFSNDKNKEKNKKLLKELKENLEEKLGLVAYPLIGHWEKDKIDLMERSLLIIKPKNIDETKFFEIVKKIAEKNDVDNFVFNGNEYQFAVYNQNGEIEFQFNEKDRENSLNSAFKKLLELENYFEGKDIIFETFFHLPKDNISGARAFPREYNHNITIHKTMEILKEK